jgi:hypothetical protein
MSSEGKEEGKWTTRDKALVVGGIIVAGAVVAWLWNEGRKKSIRHGIPRRLAMSTPGGVRYLSVSPPTLPGDSRQTLSMKSDSTDLFYLVEAGKDPSRTYDSGKVYRLVRASGKDRDPLKDSQEIELSGDDTRWLQNLNVAVGSLKFPNNREGLFSLADFKPSAGPSESGGTFTLGVPMTSWNAWRLLSFGEGADWYFEPPP